MIGLGQNPRERKFAAYDLLRVTSEIALATRRFGKLDAAHSQPDSELSRCYQACFGHGTRRQRRIGIVAIGRTLLVAVWGYQETGEVPAGAVLQAEERRRPPEVQGAGSRASVV